MTQEIIDAVRDIEREKGIESGTLVSALEDALLAAYKKTPGASRHATVEIDEQGDFRVYSIELPPDVEERLLDEARERALEELERIEAENGERSHTLLSDDDLDIDWSDVPESQVKREDVVSLGEVAQCLAFYASRPENAGRYPTPAPACRQDSRDASIAWADGDAISFGRIPDTPFTRTRHASGGRMLESSSRSARSAMRRSSSSIRSWSSFAFALLRVVQSARTSWLRVSRSDPASRT